MCMWARIALLNHNATRVLHVVTSFVVPLAPSYFSTLSHKRRDFRKKKLLNTRYVFSFSLQFFTKILLILRIIQRYHKCENVFV